MKRIILALMFLASPCLAQPVNPTDLQMQRNNFMSAFAQCDSASLALLQQIAAAQARVKALEEKYEPKAPENK